MPGDKGESLKRRDHLLHCHHFQISAAGLASRAEHCSIHQASMPLTILAEVTFLLALSRRGMRRKAGTYEIVVSLPPFGGDDP